MGDWDAPAPWYVYTLGVTALVWLACLGNRQWRWSIILGLLLLANGLLCWRQYRKGVE